MFVIKKVEIMGNKSGIKAILMLLTIIAFLFSTVALSAQNVTAKPRPIPANISKIFQNSCIPCHWSNGGMMSTARVNFSKWLDYSPAKSAEKAALIFSTLKKGKMPPKSVRESTPALIPTKEQIELIGIWADSIKKDKD
jgi:hypothetical protein